MKDFIPVIYSHSGTIFRNNLTEEALYNCVPWVLHNGEIGACPRNEIIFDSNAAGSAADRGRGLVTFAGYPDFYLDQDTFYYSGGSQDLTATTGQGYAGNTGFNEEYTASFIEHRISGVNNLVIVNAGHTSTNASANHGNVWYVADSTSAPSSISDADLPCNNGVSIIRGGASLDGYFFVGDITGKIYNSDLNDITSWSATNFLTAEREPDIGIYIGKHHDTVIYIGTRSIEFFYNAGNSTGSPLTRRSDVSYNIGCYFPNTIIETGDIIYFVGTDHDGWSRYYKIENYQLVPISDPKLEARMRIAGLGTFPDITALDSLQHYFWASTLGTNNTPGVVLTYDFQWTYYYHSVTGEWTRWSMDSAVTYPGGISSGSWNTIFPIMSYNGTNASTGSSSLVQLINGTIGREGTVDNDVMNDIGDNNNPDVFMQFATWDAGTDMKKRVNWVRILTEPVATTATTYETMDVNLRWYDYERTDAGGPNPPNDYTTSRDVNLNVRGAKVGRGGTTRSRAYIIDWPAGHGPVSIVKGLEIDYEVVGE